MMKKLKMVLVALVIALGVAFYVPTVSAETTTEPTTEQVTDTTEVVESGTDLSTIDIDLEKIKVYVIAVILSFIAQLFSGGVASIFLNKGKNAIFDFITKAKDENKISQDTATKLTTQTNQLFNDVAQSVDKLNDKFDEKMDNMSTTVKESVEGFSGLTEAFTTALAEYVTSDDDE